MMSSQTDIWRWMLSSTQGPRVLVLDLTTICHISPVLPKHNNMSDWYSLGTEINQSCLSGSGGSKSPNLSVPSRQRMKPGTKPTYLVRRSGYRYCGRPYARKKSGWVQPWDTLCSWPNVRKLVAPTRRVTSWRCFRKTNMRSTSVRTAVVKGYSVHTA